MSRPVKTLFAVGVAVPVALLHFVTGPNYGGPFPVFVNGYLIDLVLPFACYFLLAPHDYPVIKYWFVKAGLVFGFGLAVEIAQGMGLDVLGSTFDPLDIAMYGAGVGLAALLDQVVLPRLWPAWTAQPAFARKETS